MLKSSAAVSDESSSKAEHVYLPSGSDRSSFLISSAGEKARQSSRTFEPIAELGAAIPSRALEILPPGLSLRVVRGIVKQLGEKMDSVRRAAKLALERLLKDPRGYWLPIVDKLKVCISERNSFCKLLSMRDYSRAAAEGIIISVGAFAEDATSSLVAWCSTADPKSLSSLAGTLLLLLKGATSNDRVGLPCLRAAHVLLSAGAFGHLKPPKSEWSHSFLEATGAAIERTKNVSKLSAAIDVLVDLAKFERPVRTRAFGFLICL